MNGMFSTRARQAATRDGALSHYVPVERANANRSIGLSATTRRRLGLESQPNWITATEVKSFYWPGPDLRPTQKGQYAYGELPAVVFEALQQKILAASVLPNVVTRNE